jgi:transcriptional regulator with XRE-family HTH domain
VSDTLDVNAGIFDPVRLTQARRLAGLTKRALGEAVGVSSVAIGQWEAGANPPRPDHLVKLCEEFDVPLSFMLSGRPHARLEIAGAHFRSLRSTPLREREKAVAFTEQLWELTHVLERHVELPPVDLPGFSAGELSHDAMPRDPLDAARELRRLWNVPAGRIPRVVRLLEPRSMPSQLHASPARLSFSPQTEPMTSTDTASLPPTSLGIWSSTVMPSLAIVSKNARPINSPPSSLLLAQRSLPYCRAAWT